MANCYMNKAIAVTALGNNRGAVELYDRAIEIRERLVHEEGRRELANDLAWCYKDKAIAVRALVVPARQAFRATATGATLSQVHE